MADLLRQDLGVEVTFARHGPYGGSYLAGPSVDVLRRMAQTQDQIVADWVVEPAPREDWYFTDVMFQGSASDFERFLSAGNVAHPPQGSAPLAAQFLFGCKPLLSRKWDLEREVVDNCRWSILDRATVARNQVFRLRSLLALEVLLRDANIDRASVASATRLSLRSSVIEVDSRLRAAGARLVMVSSRLNLPDEGGNGELALFPLSDPQEVGEALEHARVASELGDRAAKVRDGIRRKTVVQARKPQSVSVSVFVRSTGISPYRLAIQSIDGADVLSQEAPWQDLQVLTEEVTPEV